MSFSPSVSLVRLQELKLWQGSYENLLQKSRNVSYPREREAEKCISTFETCSPKKSYSNDWDKKEISPSKPFEQLLEEKLAEDEPIYTTEKPKRPFLKKGQGLARFKMTKTSYMQQIHSTKKTKRLSEYTKNESAEQSKGVDQERKGILKKTNLQYNKDVDMSPLTVPDFVKPRGTWKRVFESSQNPGIHELTPTGRHSHEDVEDDQCNKFNNEIHFKENDETDGSTSLETFANRYIIKTPPYIDDDAQISEGEHPECSLKNLNKSIVERIKKYAGKRFLDKDIFLGNDIPDHISETLASPLKKNPGEHTTEEQKLEKELKIFEALERKVENSSFCSSNTSVVNLLASTPQKVKEDDKRKDIYIGKEDISFVNDECNTVQLKLKEINQNSDLLREFLINLHKMELNNPQESGSVDSDMFRQKSEKSVSTDTSFSDEHTRWSTRSPSLVDNYTEFDSSGSWKKIDAGVNTSFSSFKLEETLKNEEPCKECENFRAKLTEKNINFNNLQSENIKLKSQLKDLQDKYNQRKRDMKDNEKTLKEKIEMLVMELESEQKKFAKEKVYFETYVKDAQNRPTKKEREEITHLKQELADAKELLKLKDTKNGATQARLRTQIKQHEKEIAELKITVDKLQKENAKLSVNQKYMRRPAEVKMLHEINKNLSKLTEETFKRNLSKSGNGDGEESQGVRKDWKTLDSLEDVGKNNVKKVNCGNLDTDKSNISKQTSKENLKKDIVTLDLTNSDCIEKQYEHVFGSFNSPRSSNCSTSVEKTEKSLPDGSIEITYSNGNLKTISADGQVVKIKYFNGDTKETNLNEKTIRYHYAATDSHHTQYPDGSEVLEYPDGQKCTKYTDGKTEISYPDGSVRIINSDGTEEQEFPDGRKAVKNINGEQIIYLPNGQKEIHTDDFKRREYPDGTVRTLYKDGTVETIYSNGRIRLKDSNGTLIMDTHQES